MIDMNLPYRPPYDWESVLAYLQARAVRGIETVDETSYSRTIEIDGRISCFQVRRANQDAHLAITFHGFPDRELPYMSGRVREMFDLGAEPLIIADHLGKDKYLADIISRYPGLRLPGCWDGFEMVVRTIVGQQVTLKAAVTVLSRLVQRYGREFSQPGIPGLTHVFPKPEVLAEIDPVSAGMPGKRTEAIRCLARRVCSGEIVLDGSMNTETVVRRLQEIPGVGRWTTDYVAMRVLREPDAFPQTDLVIKRALENIKQAEGPAVDMGRRIDSWRPWRAYAAIYLWKDYAVKPAFGDR
jgi:3-methyladenine DNA glycosylase/8-oxoguanine DNA glycosylase